MGALVIGHEMDDSMAQSWKCSVSETNRREEGRDSPGCALFPRVLTNLT